MEALPGEVVGEVPGLFGRAFYLASMESTSAMALGDLAIGQWVWFIFECTP